MKKFSIRVSHFSTHLTPLAAALLALSSSSVLAAPPQNSAYATDAQRSYVQDATSEGINSVNMISCIMSSMRPDALVNQGNYNALIDKKKCENKGGDAGGNSGSNAPDYMSAVVTATRASNNDPMLVKSWLNFEEDNHAMTVFVNINASQAPTASNPYGQFRIDYCGKPGGSGACFFNGFLDATASGIQYFEISNNGNQAMTTALQLNASSTAAGNGRLQLSQGSQQSDFLFAYNADFFRRQDSGGDQCFSRDAADSDTQFSVWRYGLYDAVTGARIERSSGFPIEFSNGGQTYRGYLGYFGLSLPNDAMSLLNNGSTVQRVEYGGGGSPVKTDYSIIKAAGKLHKYSKQTRTLAEMDKIRFQTFVGDASSLFNGATSYAQYEFYWDNTAGTFKATMVMNCNQNGCQNSALPSEQAVDRSFWAAQNGIQGWSQSLGGEVFISLAGVNGATPASAINVIYRTEDLVYPNDMPTALYCIKDCPTAASMGSFFANGSSDPSPFVANTANNWNPTSAGNIVNYTTDSSSALLKDSNSAAVVFTDAAAISQKPQYQYGVRSGRLFSSLAGAECSNGSGTYCDSKVNELDTYYVWETGAQSWNQFAAAKDSSGNVVTFDAPLNVNYAVPNGSVYGQYAGKNIVLQYGGFGDLWGIPGKCVSPLNNQEVQCGSSGENRYVPEFVIPQDVTAGVVTANGHSYLVKWLEREIRLAKKNPSVCTAAGLNLPANVALPTASSLVDPSGTMGTQPVVSTAPRVIHGEVKY